MLFLAQKLPALDAIGETILGTILLLVLFGWLWAKPSVENLLESLKQKTAENAALRQSIEDRVIPVVEHNTQLAERVAVLLEQHTETDRLMLRRLDDLDHGGHR